MGALGIRAGKSRDVQPGTRARYKEHREAIVKEGKVQLDAGSSMIFSYINAVISQPYKARNQSQTPCPCYPCSPSSVILLRHHHRRIQSHLGRQALDHPLQRPTRRAIREAIKETLAIIARHANPRIKRHTP